MFPKIERFLRLQKAEMMNLDKAEGLQAREDSGKDFSCPDERGVQHGLREILYDNTVAWIMQEGCKKLLSKEFEELSQPGALNEDTISANVATFTTMLLPMVRRIYSRLMAMELVSVQPLSGPTGYIYWLDHLFGTQSHPSYGKRMDLVQENAYADSSEKGGIREMNFRLQKKLVETEVKKLKAIWTLESAQDLRSQLGLDMWTEVGVKVADEIGREIDSKIVAELLAQVAYNVDWSKTGYLAGDVTTADRKFYRQGIYEAILTVGAQIYKRKFGYPNWLLMNGDTFSHFQKLEKFVTDPGTDQNKPIEMGWAYKGTLAQTHRVYVNPWFTANKILMGRRSPDWRDAVGFYAPFIPLMVSEEFAVGGDFSQRARGMMSRYAYGAIGEDESDGKNYGLGSVTLTES